MGADATLNLNHSTAPEWPITARQMVYHKRGPINSAPRLPAPELLPGGSPVKRRLVLCLCSIGCLLAALPVLAQEGPRGNQLLLIMDDSLLLWDSEQGEYVALPDINPAEFSKYGWSWSPDGRYLLATNFPETYFYDVEAQAWDERVLGKYGAWSPDGSRIAHVRDIDYGSDLLLYDWDTGEETLLYSVRGTQTNSEGLSDPEWSPNGESILFVYYVWGWGGTDNYAKLLNVSTGEVRNLSGGWYASYRPIWSPNGNTFLLHIDPTTVQTRGPVIIRDAVVGDIYLFDTLTGERHAVTHTPLQDEDNIRWSEDGQSILFEVTETYEVSLEEVFAPAEPAPEVDVPETPDVAYDGARAVISTSPDGSLQVWSAWVCGLIVSDAEGHWVDGITATGEPTANGCPQLEVIGWRPLPPD